MKTRKYRVSWFAQTDHVEFHHEDMETLSGATLLFGAICRLATTSECGIYLIGETMVERIEYYHRKENEA